LINQNDTIELTSVCSKTIVPSTNLHRDNERVAVLFDTVLSRRMRLPPWDSYGRYTLDVTKQNNQLNIAICVYREGTTSNCGNNFYYFTIKHAQNRVEEYLEIFDTLRGFLWDTGNNQSRRNKRFR